MTLKAILVGDGGVGKTSLVTRYVDRGPFQADYKLTIGVDMSNKVIQLTSGDIVSLSLHDVAGQIRFESVRSIFFKGSHLAFCVFDITRRNSLEILENNWMPDIEQNNLLTTSSGIITQKLLIGNKNDLEDLREISQKEGEEASKRMGCFTYIETSAKENTNVNKAFTFLTEKYVELHKISLN
ncbi:MAG: Rab family GTPase [Candidatus Hodarchaeales archaeon]